MDCNYRRLIILLLSLPVIIFSILFLTATIRALTFKDINNIDYELKDNNNSVIINLSQLYLEDNLPRVFSGALKIPTISSDTNEILAFHQFLRDSFPNIFNSSFITVDIVNNYSILLTVKGDDEEEKENNNNIQKPYLLVAHFDVVPVDRTEWLREPFGGEIIFGDPETGEKEDFIWGRGAIDNKINVIGIMMSLEHLATNGFHPERTFYVALGHDEEVSGYDGAGRISRLLRERGVVTLDFILDEGLPLTRGVFEGIDDDVPVATIGVTEKGWMRVILRVEGGEGGHSSMPPSDQVAARLGRALNNLEQYPQPSMFGEGTEAEMFDYVASASSWPYKLIYANVWLFKPILEKVLASSRETNAIIRTTTAATVVRVGDKENVVPASGYAIINHRVHPAQSLADVLKHDIYAIGDPKVEVTLEKGYEAHPISPYGPEVPAWRLITSIVKHIYPTAVSAPGVLIANTDTRHFLNMTKFIYRFNPMVLTKKDISGIHGANERLSLTNAKKVVWFYHRLIQIANQDNNNNDNDNNNLEGEARRRRSRHRRRSKREPSDPLKYHCHKFACLQPPRRKFLKYLQRWQNNQTITL